jgi:hypothetical protein
VAIQATVQTRQILWNVVYAVLCGGLALWGAWDYWVTIPRAEADAIRFEEASAVHQQLAEVSQSRSLDDAERAAFLDAEEVLNEFKDEPPVKPAAYDRAVQLWLYMVGCGVLGTPAFLWNLIVLPRQARQWRLDDDGSLHTPTGTFAANEIAEIDMSRWMAKSIATVKAADGREAKLDDYKFRGMHLIVGALASRFHPEEWTEEARMKTPPAEEASPAGEAAADSAEESGADAPSEDMGRTG